MVVGRILGGQRDLEPILQFALYPALRDCGLGLGSLGLVACRRRWIRKPSGSGCQWRSRSLLSLLLREGFVGIHHLDDGLHLLCLLLAEQIGTSGQLHSCKPNGDASAYRSRMVFLAVLCDLAFDSPQVGRSCGHVGGLGLVGGSSVHQHF